MTKRTLEQILAELRSGKRPLLVNKSDESDENRYDCPACKDQGAFSKNKTDRTYGRYAAVSVNEK